MVQYEAVDASFAALADPTRRGILERLSQGPATITALAGVFGMTLTGLSKHVHVLEDAGLVVTEKDGRTRTCLLGGNALDLEVAWMQQHRDAVERRLDRLGEFLDRTKGQK